MDDLQILPYTQERIKDVLAFERRLREEENFWGWEIDEAYEAAVERSFQDPRFANALSLLAYREGQVVGRIDAVLICSRFDGSVKAYLDWICVLKSQRHRGAAQALMAPPAGGRGGRPDGPHRRQPGGPAVLPLPGGSENPGRGHLDRPVIRQTNF